MSWTHIYILRVKVYTCTVIVNCTTEKKTSQKVLFKDLEYKNSFQLSSHTPQTQFSVLSMTYSYILKYFLNTNGVF